MIQVHKKWGIFKIWTGKWHAWAGIDWHRTVIALSASKYYSWQFKFGILCDGWVEHYTTERRLYASLVLFLGLFGMQVRFVRKSKP